MKGKSGLKLGKFAGESKAGYGNTFMTMGKGHGAKKKKMANSGKSKARY
jgi:hypothetical protein